MPAAAEESPSSIRSVNRPEARVSLAAGHRPDLGHGLLQRLVDGLDDLLAGLVRAHRADHVDHRARRIGARALEHAGAHLAGALAGDGARGAGDVVATLLARVAQQ